jgi:hypothetical protein
MKAVPTLKYSSEEDEEEEEEEKKEERVVKKLTMKLPLYEIL